MSLQKLKPRHREIMRRLVQGHTQSEIARDMSIDTSVLCVMVNAPLFQQELRSLEASAEGKALRLQNVLFEAAAAGMQLHKDIVNNVLVGKDGMEMDLDVRVRQRSATDALVLAARVIKFAPTNGDGGGGMAGSDVPYERRLRETIIRETYVKGVANPSDTEHLATTTHAIDDDDDLDYLLNCEEDEAESTLMLPSQASIEHAHVTVTAVGE